MSFDASFQTKIVAMALRDSVFLRQSEGLILPEQFENYAEAAVVALLVEYYEKYSEAPSIGTVVHILKDKFDKKVLRDDAKDDIKDKLKDLQTTDISDRDFVLDEVATFARHQALEQAIIDSVGHLEKRDFDKIGKVVEQALQVGIADGLGSYDYLDEVDNRKAYRHDLVTGKIKRQGISTGHKELDALLYHKGWGRKELSLFLGGPKAGKTAQLIDCARNAAQTGHNVLYVTLEVSSKIVADRMDANIADMDMGRVERDGAKVADRILSRTPGYGKLVFEEFPTGSLTPRDLRRIIARHRARGTIFDMVVVDYADLMAPTHRVNDSIENSKSIYIELRAIAQEENIAMLSATQTNRDGYKSAIASSEHVADDFNKVRIADVLISINVSPTDLAKDEARLYLAAMRNSEGGRTITVSRDMAKAQPMKSVIAVD